MIHSFDSEIAKVYGLVEAILLQNFAFWIAKNEANERNYYDGKYWTYNSINAFKELFPYLTTKQLRRGIDHLIADELLVTGNYNSDRYNRTLWYALTQKGKCICLTGQMDIPKRANGIAPEGKSTNTDNKQQIINTDINIYGEFKNVRLSEEEYNKIKEKGLLPVLEELSGYMASTGKKYKSHYATILNWGRRKQAEGKKLKSQPSFNVSDLQRQAELNDNFDI